MAGINRIYSAKARVAPQPKVRKAQQDLNEYYDRTFTPGKKVELAGKHLTVLDSNLAQNSGRFFLRASFETRDLIENNPELVYELPEYLQRSADQLARRFSYYLSVGQQATVSLQLPYQEEDLPDGPANGQDSVTISQKVFSQPLRLSIMPRIEKNV